MERSLALQAIVELGELIQETSKEYEFDEVLNDKFYILINMLYLYLRDDYKD